jgi:hypothetical protein
MPGVKAAAGAPCPERILAVGAEDGLTAGAPLGADAVGRLEAAATGAPQTPQNR